MDKVWSKDDFSKALKMMLDSSWGDNGNEAAKNVFISVMNMYEKVGLDMVEKEPEQNNFREELKKKGLETGKKFSEYLASRPKYIAPPKTCSVCKKEKEYNQCFSCYFCSADVCYYCSHEYLPIGEDTGEHQPPRMCHRCSELYEKHKSRIEKAYNAYQKTIKDVEHQISFLLNRDNHDS